MSVSRRRDMALLGRPGQIRSLENGFFQVGNLFIAQSLVDIAPRRELVGRRGYSLLLLRHWFFAQRDNLNNYLLVVLKMTANDLFKRLALGGVDVPNIARDRFHDGIIPCRHGWGKLLSLRA